MGKWRTPPLLRTALRLNRRNGLIAERLRNPTPDTRCWHTFIAATSTDYSSSRSSWSSSFTRFGSLLSLSRSLFQFIRCTNWNDPNPTRHRQTLGFSISMSLERLILLPNPTKVWNSFAYALQVCLYTFELLFRIDVCPLINVETAIEWYLMRTDSRCSTRPTTISTLEKEKTKNFLTIIFVWPSANSSPTLIHSFFFFCFVFFPFDDRLKSIALLLVQGAIGWHFINTWTKP